MSGVVPEFRNRVARDRRHRWQTGSILWARASRLREVRALAGFSRIEPYPAAAERVNDAIRMAGLAPVENAAQLVAGCRNPRGGHLLPLPHRNRQFLDRMPTPNWSAVRRSSKPAAVAWPSNVEYSRNYTITPRLLLVHSFSHALIRQISVECGYSASALRERLYVSEADGPRAGHERSVLIYTGSPDSEGSLGGLVRLAEPELLEPIIRRTLDSVGWCGSDPVCIETDPRPVWRARKRSGLPLLPAAARDSLREIQPRTGQGSPCGRCAKHFRGLLRRC